MLVAAFGPVPRVLRSREDTLTNLVEREGSAGGLAARGVRSI
ncbi:MAG: hypothetical protein QOI71_632 [Gaiellales bacterium]|nr:hypothetical protein [Gaiellales bacterium]